MIPNPFTIDHLKNIEYKDDSNATKILEELITSMENPENSNLTLQLVSSDQSLKLWFYSDRRLAEIEHISIVNYVENKKKMFIHQ